MIENEEIGLKIAESHEEELWEKFRQVKEQNVKVAEDNLFLEKEMLKWAEQKLRELEEKDE